MLYPMTIINCIVFNLLELLTLWFWLASGTDILLNVISSDLQAKTPGSPVNESVSETVYVKCH